ncbi:hypothetical protein GQ44DRAFT_727357 [Phaeosphaeriaceae sp. PMI808]|nr:hypothetical protein GQ44DRAFT_727357 [Phaeosphaeriaceae sp. PMI808]
MKLYSSVGGDYNTHRIHSNPCFSKDLKLSTTIKMNQINRNQLRSRFRLNGSTYIMWAVLAIVRIDRMVPRVNTDPRSLVDYAPQAQSVLALRRAFNIMTIRFTHNPVHDQGRWVSLNFHSARTIIDNVLINLPPNYYDPALSNEFRVLHDIITVWSELAIATHHQRTEADDILDTLDAMQALMARVVGPKISEIRETLREMAQTAGVSQLLDFGNYMNREINHLSRIVQQFIITQAQSELYYEWARIGEHFAETIQGTFDNYLGSLFSWKFTRQLISQDEEETQQALEFAFRTIARFFTHQTYLLKYFWEKPWEGLSFYSNEDEDESSDCIDASMAAIHRDDVQIFTLGDVLSFTDDNGEEMYYDEGMDDVTGYVYDYNDDYNHDEVEDYNEEFYNEHRDGFEEDNEEVWVEYEMTEEDQPLTGPDHVDADAVSEVVIPTDTDVCVICQDSTAHQTARKLIICGHVYGEQCLVGQLEGRHQSRYRCAICRAEML